MFGKFVHSCFCKACKCGSVLFWDFTQRRMIVAYRRFGTICQSQIQESSSPRRMLGTLRCAVYIGSGVGSDFSQKM
jgi:hypothetical protein